METTKFLSLSFILLLSSCKDGGENPVIQTNPTCVAERTLSLQYGDTATLTPQEASCFMIKGDGNYILAGMDTRAVETSRSMAEPAWLSEVTYWLEDRTVPEASNKGLSLSVGVPLSSTHGPDLMISSSVQPEQYDPGLRSTPWKEGEVFNINRHISGEIVTARVKRIFGNIVIAVVEGDNHSRLEKYLSDTYTAMSDYVVPKAIPRLREIFGTLDPVTSKNAGQMLILVSAWDPDLSSGNATGQLVANHLLTRIDVNMNVSGGYNEGYAIYDTDSYRLKLILHELTHAWQSAYAHQESLESGALSFGTLWASEGTADMFALEGVREYLGINLLSNWNWRTTAQRTYSYTQEARLASTTFVSGYYSASSFLRDQEARLIRIGVSEPLALKEIILGAMEGFYGNDIKNTSGLAMRMKKLYGAEWIPEDRIMLWAVSQAADDATSLADIQNFMYKEVSNPEVQTPWGGAIEGIVKNGNGERYSFTSSYGSPVYVRLSNKGDGYFSVGANVSSKWMLVRVK